MFLIWNGYLVVGISLSMNNIVWKVVPANCKTVPTLHELINNFCANFIKEMCDCGIVFVLWGSLNIYFVLSILRQWRRRFDYNTKV